MVSSKIVVEKQVLTEKLFYLQRYGLAVIIRIVLLIKTYILVYYMTSFGIVIQIRRPPDQRQPGGTQNASYETFSYELWNGFQS